MEQLITPGPVDWFAVDFGGHVHAALEIAGERVEDQ